MNALLEVQDLSVSFDTDEGVVRAVDRVSFSVDAGQTLGIVGESGCGKSVSAMSIPRLIPSPPGRIDRGRVLFRGRELLGLPAAELRPIRGKRISMIFQEPMTALSPLHRVGRQLVEAQQLHARITRRRARATAEEWLRRVGIPDPAEKMFAYPFQLSGGMRQRVVIAMALMLDPELVIADEPTTALDVTIEAQVLDLMRVMKKKDAALILITHDMGVIWDMCTHVLVMYASEVVENGTAAQVFDEPLHPYTQALLASMPGLRGGRRRLETIKGQVPSAINYPPGCRFRERCRFAFSRCAVEHPPMFERAGRRARCFRLDEKSHNVGSGT